MSTWQNPSFYISIFSTVCLIASEILPFVPHESNGLLHSILVILSKYSPKNTTDVTPVIENKPVHQEILEDNLEIKDKIDRVLKTLETTKELTYEV